ncbi:MAG: rod shape-determining protein MreC [bacterium]|nr:rod shape-determining protein MreC [bacterium]
MFNLLTRYRHISLFILFLLISLALLSLDQSVKETLPESSSVLERVLLRVLLPFQRMVTVVVDYGQNFWGRYIALVHLSDENARLQEEIKRLRAEKNRYAENALAYERLKGTLDLVKDRRFSSILASVIGHDPTNHFNTIIVNRGAEHGVQESWPVITQDGIVGVTVSVSTKSSKVLLLIDPNCNVAALIQRTRDQGVVGGLSRQDAYTMKYVNRRSDIRQGSIFKMTQHALMELAKEGIPGYMLTEMSLKKLKENFISPEIPIILEQIKDTPYQNQRHFVRALETTLGKEQADLYKGILVQHAQAGVLLKLLPLKGRQFSSEEEFLNALKTAIGPEDVLKYQQEIFRHTREEEIVISSGLGGIFPKGLILGTVSKVLKQNYGLFQQIEVTPSVDFSKLEEVLIIRRDAAIAAQ